MRKANWAKPDAPTALVWYATHETLCRDWVWHGQPQLYPPPPTIRRQSQIIRLNKIFRIYDRSFMYLFVVVVDIQHFVWHDILLLNLTCLSCINPRPPSQPVTSSTVHQLGAVGNFHPPFPELPGKIPTLTLGYCVTSSVPVVVVLYGNAVPACVHGRVRFRPYEISF